MNMLLQIDSDFCISCCDTTKDALQYNCSHCKLTVCTSDKCCLVFPTYDNNLIVICKLCRIRIEKKFIPRHFSADLKVIKKHIKNNTLKMQRRKMQVN